MLIYCCHKIIYPSLLSVGRPERDGYRNLGTQYFCTCAKPSKFMWKKKFHKKTRFVLIDQLTDEHAYTSMN